MDLNESNIKSVVNGVPVGDFSPFSDSEVEACDAYAKKLCKKIEECYSLEVISELDSYGSGYASYFDLFVTKRDKSQYTQKEGYVEIKGISLYISRVAPVAVYGQGQRTRSENGGSYGFLDASAVGAEPSGDWSAELDQIRNYLNIYKYSLLSRSEVNKTLWFDVFVPTILGSETVFDALFYWAD
jgi:hypothetical protein